MDSYVEQYILNNYQNKKYSEMVADLAQFGITQDKIRYFLKNHGLKKKVGSFTEEQDNYIRENYMSKPVKDIAKALGFKCAQIASRANYLGLSKYVVYKGDYFSTIDTPQKAYFLGFIYADGYVETVPEKYYYRFGFKLQVQDDYILKKLNEEMGGMFKIKYEDPCETEIMGVKTVSNGTASLIIHSKALVSDLMRLNILPNKSYRTDIIPYIPEDYFFDWLRGYIDGNGSFSQSGKYGLQLSIVGTNTSLFELLKSRLLEYGIKMTIYTKDKTCHVLYASKRSHIEKLTKLLYYDNCLCLSRKRKKVENFWASSCSDARLKEGKIGEG